MSINRLNQRQLLSSASPFQPRQSDVVVPQSVIREQTSVNSGITMSSGITSGSSLSPINGSLITGLPNRMTNASNLGYGRPVLPDNLSAVPILQPSSLPAVPTVITSSLKKSGISIIPKLKPSGMDNSLARLGVDVAGFWGANKMVYQRAPDAKELLAFAASDFVANFGARDWVKALLQNFGVGTASSDSAIIEYLAELVSVGGIYTVIEMLAGTSTSKKELLVGITGSYALDYLYENMSGKL